MPDDDMTMEVETYVDQYGVKRATTSSVNFVATTPRQSGKTSLSNQPFHQPRSRTRGGATGPLSIHVSFKLLQFQPGDVIRWVARGRGANNRNVEYTYAAVMAGDKWYITGAGHWYNTNALTVEQMREVLERDEVLHVEWCSDFTAANLW